MRPILLVAGIPKHQLDIIPKNYKTATLAKAFDWLHDIYLSNIYNDVKIIYQSVSPFTWETYDLLGIEDLTEQRLLKQKSKPLLKLWKTKRPRLFINRQIEICKKCEGKAIFTYSNGTKVCSLCNNEVYLDEQEADTEKIK